MKFGSRVRLVTDSPAGFGVLASPEASDYTGTTPSGTEGTLEGEWPVRGLDGWYLVRLDDGSVVPARLVSLEMDGD